MIECHKYVTVYSTKNDLFQWSALIISRVHPLNCYDRGVLIPKKYLNFSGWILIELDKTNTPI